MSKQQIFRTLWSRMAERGDFPALQYSVRNIVQAMQEEGATTAELTSAVLSDFTLTQKVIRLANSEMYAPFGGDVSTVSHAIMVLGAETIGHLAVGLQLLNNFTGLAAGKEDAAAELKQALLAGEFTRHCTATKGPKESESAVVCALMHPLARLLLVFYFPEEWPQITALIETEALDENTACERVLGVSIKEIAAEAAGKWGLPLAIASSMRPAPLTVDTPLASEAEWLGAVARLAFLAAQQLAQAQTEEQIQRFAIGFAQWLGLDEASLCRACQKMAELKAKLDASVSLELSPPRRRVEGRPLGAHKLLQQGLAKVRSMSPHYPVTDVLPLALETLMQAMGFTHCLAFLLYPTLKRFEARVGFGPDVRAKLPQMMFDEGFVPDVFHLSFSQMKAVFIEDAQEPHIVQRLPGWYCNLFPDVQSFLLLPVQMRHRCIALLYGDWGALPCQGKPNADELELLMQLGKEIALSFERQLLAQHPVLAKPGMGFPLAG